MQCTALGKDHRQGFESTAYRSRLGIISPYSIDIQSKDGSQKETTTPQASPLSCFANLPYLAIKEMPFTTQTGGRTSPCPAMSQPASWTSKLALRGRRICRQVLPQPILRHLLTCTSYFLDVCRLQYISYPHAYAKRQMRVTRHVIHHSHGLIRPYERSQSKVRVRAP
jgi:hypothetical protein